MYLLQVLHLNWIIRNNGILCFVHRELKQEMLEQGIIFNFRNMYSTLHQLKKVEYWIIRNSILHLVLYICFFIIANHYLYTFSKDRIKCFWIFIELWISYESKRSSNRRGTIKLMKIKIGKRICGCVQFIVCNISQ